MNLNDKIKLHNKSLRCLALELPQSVYTHHRAIADNMLISVDILRECLKDVLRNPLNPDATRKGSRFARHFYISEELGERINEVLGETNGQRTEVLD